MTFKSLLKSGGLAALAIGLAAPALSVEAFAQDRPQRGNWRGGDNNGGGGQQADGGASEYRQQVRQERREARQEQRQAQNRNQQPQRQQQQSAPPPPPHQAQAPQGGGWQRGGGSENRGGQRWQGQGRPERAEGIYNPQIDRNRDRSGERVVGTNPPQDRNWQGNRDTNRDGRDWNRDGRNDNRDRNWSGNNTGGSSGTWNRDGNRDRNWQGDRDRDRDYRDNNRNRDYRNRDWNGSYRDGYRDARRDDRRDHRRWDRRWRDNNRYNWNSYRYSHRHIYTPGRYYAPYRNYSYRRLSIGFYLDNLFFGSRYWINDPWQYRLPPVYGDYRWVRYYDDVLLVDMYSGEVVDVIYDFFW